MFHSHRYDIRLKLETNSKKPTEKIDQLRERDKHSELVALKDNVSIESGTSMSEINRVQRERAITVYANVKGDQSQQLALQAAKDIG